MKNMTNTIGKKNTHTLVKEITPHWHKIRQECDFTQKVAFPLDHCVFFPAVVQILVSRLDSCFLTNTNTYKSSIHALIFEKHIKMCVHLRHNIIKKPVYMPLFLKNMSKCVFMQDILKSRCKFVTLLGKYAQQKQVGWEVIFQNLGLQGPGRVSPGGSSRAAPSTFFAACSEALGASIV